MIYLTTGRTGRGKTFDSIRSILEDMRNLKVVFTNIRLNIESPLYHYMDELSMKNYISYIRDTFSSVDNLDEKKDEVRRSVYFGGSFYLDECQLLGFGKRDEALINWLTLQRHFNQDIHLITQQPGLLHRDYLPLVHFHKDMLKSILPNTFGYKLYDGYRGELIQTKFYKPEKIVFDIYSTGKVENFIHPHIYKLAAVLIFLALAVSYLLYSFSDPANLVSGSLHHSVSKEKVGKELSVFSSNKHSYSIDENSKLVVLRCIGTTCFNHQFNISIPVESLFSIVEDTNSKIISNRKYSLANRIVTLYASEYFLLLFNKGVKNVKKDSYR